MVHICYHGQKLSTEERKHATTITVDRTVEIIDLYAFSGCISLTQIHIPDTVRRIHNCAFEDCQSLTFIDLPDSVTHIGGAAFYLCVSLSDIRLPSGITCISSYCFGSCTSLSSINLPVGITHIYDGAFTDCESLLDMVMPDALIYIGDTAFQYCESLTHVVLPLGLMYIGIWAFECCVSLHLVTIAVRCNGSSEAMLQLSNDVHHAKMTCISTDAFSKCRDLKQIYIPNAITRIEQGAFSECSALEQIYIPDGLNQIDASAFQGCETLVNLYTRFNQNVRIVEENGLFHVEDSDKFHNWLISRYDEYPFLKLCFKPGVTMQRILSYIEEHGIHSITEVEKFSQINGFDIILSNATISESSFDIIANIIILSL